MLDYKRIGKFLVSGLLAAAIEYATFLLLIAAVSNIQLVVAQTLSFLMGLVVSFILNKRWVFGSNRATSHALRDYLLLALTNLLLSNVLLILLGKFLPVVLAKVIVMACVATWNYAIFQKFIFRQNS